MSKPQTFEQQRTFSRIRIVRATGIVKLIMILKMSSKIITCHAKSISIHYSITYRLYLAFKEKSS